MPSSTRARSRVLTTLPLFAVLALVALIPAFISVNAPRMLRARGSNGVVDLADGLATKRPIMWELDGPWEFYPGRFYTYDDFAAADGLDAPALVTAPHTWTADGLPRRGYGTYRLRVLIPEGQDSIGVYAQAQGSAYAIYLDSDQVFRSGGLDPSFETFYMNFQCLGGYIVGRPSLPSTECEVIVHVQNDTYAMGGLRKPVYLGNKAATIALRSVKDTLDSFFTGCLTVLICYTLLAFLLNRDRIEYLDYGLSALAMVWVSLESTGSALSPYYQVTARFPPGGAATVLRLAYLTPLAGIFFIVRAPLSRLIPRRALGPVYAVSAALVSFPLWTPVAFFTGAYALNAGVAVVLTLVPLADFLAGLRGRRPGEEDIPESRAIMIVNFLCCLLLILVPVSFVFPLSPLVNSFVVCTDLYLMARLAILLLRYHGLEEEVHALNRGLERKVAERTADLEAMTEEARRASRYKSDFLARMSHEIRTPLNAIIGMSDLMPTGNFDETQRRYFKDISGMSSTLFHLINDILDFSKIEAGKMELTPVHYNLRRLFENLASMGRFMAGDKNLRFVSTFAPGLDEVVFGDELRVRQVWTNLVTNAIKYTKEGTVEFSLRAEERDLGSGPRRYIAAMVRDTGQGIKPEDQHKLFGEFERFNRNQNRGVVGTGLGLAITRQLVEMMGGTITLESVYGKGSTFTALVPLEPGNAALVLEDGEGQPPARAASGVKVLVVDDMRVNLTVALGMLARHGIEADTAASGEEALQKTAAMAERGERYDLILMDHMMPGMDGLETTRRYREMEQASGGRTPVVACSANAVDGAKELFLEAGMDDFVSKPISAAELNRALVRWLPESKRIAEPAGAAGAAGGDGAAKSDATTAGGDGAASGGVTTAGDGVARGDATTGSGDGATRGDESGVSAAFLAAALDLNLAAALQHLGSAQQLEQYLRLFAADYGSYLEALQTAWAAKDWKGYAVRVHSFKGVFATLGRDDIAAAAQTLETAAKEGRAEDCEAGTPDLMECLAAFQEALTVVLPAAPLPGDGAQSGATALDAASLRALLEALSRALRDNQGREVRRIARALDEAALDGPVAEAWRAIKPLLDAFDYGAAEDRMGGLRDAVEASLAEPPESQAG